MNNYQTKNNLKVINNPSAVIQIGTQQYKVSERDIISVQLLKAKIGKTINLNKVLSLTFTQANGLIVSKIGNPILLDCKVQAVILQNIKLKKQLQFKGSPRNNDKKQKGINQPATILKVVNVSYTPSSLINIVKKSPENETKFKLSYKQLNYISTPEPSTISTNLPVKHFNLTKNNLNKLEKLETQKR